MIPTRTIQASEADIHQRARHLSWWGWPWYRSITGQGGDHPAYRDWLGGGHAPNHTHSSSPEVFNGTFGKESLSCLVMGSSGAPAILKPLHQHRGEGRITKKVDTGVT